MIPFIPACTGRTDLPVIRLAVASFHPCLHRADKAFVLKIFALLLSSLLAQGGRPHAGPVPPQHPFIPACTGRTGQFSGLAPALSFHPCLHRADSSAVTFEPYLGLSSLLAQGGLHGEYLSHTPATFIPACTGRTLKSRRRRPRKPFHPCLHRADPPPPAPAPGPTPFHPCLHRADAVREEDGAIRALSSLLAQGGRIQSVAPSAYIVLTRVKQGIAG